MLKFHVIKIVIVKMYLKCIIFMTAKINFNYNSDLKNRNRRKNLVNFSQENFRFTRMEIP